MSVPLLKYLSMTEATTGNKEKLIERMFTIGAHFGYSKSRRHPSTKPYIFGAKNKVEIFDLEKTSDLLVGAQAFVAKLASEGKKIVFVGGKNEAHEAVVSGAKAIGMPYASARWIGGTFSNFVQIRKRMNRLEELKSDRAKGELAKKYTKKEQLLIDREIDRLEGNFAGLVGLTELPAALFVVDPKKEHIAVAEALQARVPIIALMNSDCDARDIAYPIVANDATSLSIKFFVEEIVSAYKEGAKTKKAE